LLTPSGERCADQNEDYVEVKIKAKGNEKRGYKLNIVSIEKEAVQRMTRLRNERETENEDEKNEAAEGELEVGDQGGDAEDEVKA
jgi:hypothetical protein